MTARIERWTGEPPPADVKDALARLARVPDVARLAVMPDVHLAHEVCVGVALATRGVIYPQAVGGDIGCGIMAQRFGVSAEALGDCRVADQIFAGLSRVVPAIKHAGPRAELPDPASLSHPHLERLARKTGARQLGTLGRGNHFLELQRDEEGALWAMVHSGSRGMGPAIRDWHLRRASTEGRLRGFDADSDDGRAYLGDLRWALSYAEASRIAMLEALARVLDDVVGVAPEPETRVGCHHNFVRREPVDGAWLWVHRKGVISAGEGEPGIIAGSMSAPSFHVTGRGCQAALSSASHGAGRVMSRTEARRRVSRRELLRQMQGVWFDARRARQLCDEAPGAYKDIGAVMRAQRKLIRVVRRVFPLLSYKGP